MQHKIADVFSKIVEQACEEQPLEDFLEEEIDEDCSGLDFDDTTQLFDEYEDECLEWLRYALLIDCVLWLCVNLLCFVRLNHLYTLLRLVHQMP